MENNCVENKIWLQQENESDAYYKLFSAFLNYNGNLKSFAEEQGIASNSDYTPNYIKKIASQNDWKIRKKAFVNHKQKVNYFSKADELEHQRNFQKIELIKTTSVELYESMIHFLDSKKKSGIAIYPEGEELEIIKYSAAIYEKSRSIKQKLGFQDDESSASGFEGVMSAVATSLDDED